MRGWVWDSETRLHPAPLLGLWDERKKGRNKMHQILTVVSTPIQSEPRVQRSRYLYSFPFPNSVSPRL